MAADSGNQEHTEKSALREGNMVRIKIAAAVLGLLVLATALVWGCGGSTASTSSLVSGTSLTGGSGSVDGRTVFVDHCARCHGQNGEGGAGPDLRTVADPVRVEAQVRGGGAAMPSFAEVLSNEQIAGVVGYVVSLSVQ